MRELDSMEMIVKITIKAAVPRLVGEDTILVAKGSKGSSYFLGFGFDTQSFFF